ncbi:MAG: DUF302 domain-containing protein [Oceanospirillaceae bacterium]
MIKTLILLPVDTAVERIKTFLLARDFTVFADIVHQANAASVDLKMAGSRVLVFGNPMAGTKLMQKDISISLELPLRLAVVEQDQQTFLLHQSTEDYTSQYQVENHPVLAKISQLYIDLIQELNQD